MEYKHEYMEEYGFNEYQDTKTSFEVQFESIIEYAKVDGKNSNDRTLEEQAYDWNSDIIVQSRSFDDWGNFTNVTDTFGGVQSFFSVKNVEKTVEFNFTISRASFGEKVTANTMKIDRFSDTWPDGGGAAGGGVMGGGGTPSDGGGGTSSGGGTGGS